MTVGLITGAWSLWRTAWSNFTTFTAASPLKCIGAVKSTWRVQSIDCLVGASRYCAAQSLQSATSLRLKTWLERWDPVLPKIRAATRPDLQCSLGMTILVYQDAPKSCKWRISKFPEVIAYPALRRNLDLISQEFSTISLVTSRLQKKSIMRSLTVNCQTHGVQVFGELQSAHGQKNQSHCILMRKIHCLDAI